MAALGGVIEAGVPFGARETEERLDRRAAAVRGEIFQAVGLPFVGRPWSGDKPAAVPGAAAEPRAGQPGSAPQQEEKARDRWWKRWFGGDR